MTDHDSPAIDQTARNHDDQSGERLDADKLPAEMPQKPVASFAHGTTEAEQREGESLDGKLARERPDQPVERGPAEGTTSTSLADDADTPTGIDNEKDLVAERPLTEPHVDDSGQPDAGVPAEEQAVRVDDADDVPGAVDHHAVREA